MKQDGHVGQRYGNHCSEARRKRAEQAYGAPLPDRSPTLTASEIGAFVFCPQAWYLQRCRLPVTAEAEVRREAGTQAHRKIGRDTDLVRATGALQMLLLAGIALILILLVALMLRGLP